MIKIITDNSYRLEENEITNIKSFEGIIVQVETISVLTMFGVKYSEKE